MSAPQNRETSRIAIKLGGPASSTQKKAARPLPASSLGKRPRPSNNGLGGDSSESEDEAAANGRHELITAFGANGAEVLRSAGDERDDRSRAKRGPLVIERQANRDWRTEARARNQRGARQSAPPGMSRDGKPNSVEPAVAADESKPMQWGLTITKAAAAAAAAAATETAASGGPRDSDQKTPTASRAHSPDSEGAQGSPANADESVEKEAVRVLLGQTIDDRTKTKRVIERVANTATEDDVFERDFHDAPEASTLEEYEAMPVEEFGAALLRGMGWDGKDRGPKVKQVVRRPNQLGLGAKELKGAEDLGAWNHKSGSGTAHKQRPPKLHEYRREEEKRRERREERYRDSYKGERDRERDERRSGGHHAASSNSSSRHHSRHRR